MIRGTTTGTHPITERCGAALVCLVLAGPLLGIRARRFPRLRCRAINEMRAWEQCRIVYLLATGAVVHFVAHVERVAGPRALSARHFVLEPRRVIVTA